MPASFEFEHIWVFLFVPLPLIIYWIMPPLRQSSASLRMPDLESLERITGKKASKKALVKRRGFFSWIGFYLIWLLLLISMASPVLVGKPEMQVKTSRNFLILADLSFSMAQRDWFLEGERVRRWDAVKGVLKDFIKMREGDRMGLVFFASNAYVQAPFSPDLEVVNQLLDEADVGMAGQMTNIGKAMLKGKALFDRDTLETKVALLFTDGVDSGMGVLPLDAAAQVARDSIKVYTIGIGDPQGGNSDLDEQTLKQISQETGAKYFRAIDADVLEQITKELNVLEPIEFEEASYKPKTLLYYYPTLLAVFLALIFTGIFSIQSFYKIRKND